MAVLKIKDNGTIKPVKSVKLKGSEEWAPQPDWWDIDTILENDTEDYVGKAILLLSDTYPTTTINRYGASKIVTSDGIEYGTTATSYNHTWDTTKDKSCSEGYKTRYIIWYFPTRTLNMGNNQLISNFQQMYLIFKNLDITATNPFYNASLLEAVKYVNCENFSNQFAIGGAAKLKKIIGYINNNLTSCNLSAGRFIDRETFNMSTITDLTYFYGQSQEENISFPDKINLSNILSYNNTFSNSLVKVIDKLNFNNASNITNMFYGCANLISINEISNIKISGLNFSSCSSLNHDTLIRILNALADYSESENTYTITLGSINLAKLTSAEIAIGTNKGWTIS